MMTMLMLFQVRIWRSFETDPYLCLKTPAIIEVLVLTTAWKVSVFGVILVHILLHLDSTDTEPENAVNVIIKFSN